jgi:hypothetical protein
MKQQQVAQLPYLKTFVMTLAAASSPCLAEQAEWLSITRD